MCICVYNCVYMRVNIWILEHQLKKIDDYCDEHDIPRSKLLIKATLNSIDSVEKKVNNEDKGVYTQLTPKGKPTLTIKDLKKATSNICKHGSMKGLCKYGC